MKTKRYQVGQCTHCGRKDSVLKTEITKETIDGDTTYSEVETSISKCGYCKKENTLRRFHELNK
jgi:hypothetical protein